MVDSALGRYYMAALKNRSQPVFPLAACCFLYLLFYIWGTILWQQ